MIPILILLAFLAIIAWIVYSAGWRFALKRLGSALVVLVIVTFGISFMLRYTSGDDSTRQALQELGVSENALPCVTALGTAITPEAVGECVEERGLDEDPFTQYGRWVMQIVPIVGDGDLGYAFYKNQEPLSEVMKQRLPRTAWLFLYSQITALVLAVPIGIWSAYQAGRPGRGVPAWLLPVIVGSLSVLGLLIDWKLTSVFAIAVLVPVFTYQFFRGGRGADTTVNFTAFALLSIPVFVLGEALRYAFAIERDIFDLTGYAPWSDGVWNHISSIWLPALVLGLAATPVYLRLLRADMIQNLQQDYVSVAKAKGMSNTHILLRHVLRPSTVTLITVLGLNIAQLVNGAIVIEFIYDFDGMGSYLIEAFARREYFAVQTIVALVAVLFILTNTVIDVLYTAVDPRVKADDER